MMRIVEVTLRTKAKPKTMDERKIIKVVEKFGEIMSPFYTIKRFQENMIAVYFNGESYSFVYDKETKTFENKIDATLFKYLIMGKMSEKFWEYFDCDEINVNGIPVKRAGSEVRGTLVVVNDKKFLRNHTEKYLSFVDPEKRCRIELDGNYAMVMTKEWILIVSTEYIDRVVDVLYSESRRRIQKELFPGVSLGFIKKVFVAEGRLNGLEYSTGKKYGTIGMKIVDGGVKYYNVPYLEGIYNIVVPVGCEDDVISPLSVKELPECVKKSRKRRYTYGKFKDFEKVYAGFDTFGVWFDGVHAHYNGYEYSVEVDGKKYLVPEEVFYRIVSGEVGKSEVVMMLNFL